ncbi:MULTISPECIES: ABC transporter permease [unclassified Rothia (in: high G+C Gram-positive bacteria)]|uniref:ABC transporter permease n=1 Tax=unclassified Rothia (in: high G+C Gram-positive bacteria) TaxID=2689056 RepID=UPI0019568037|nr:MULTISPECIES: ABC transporter permease [unclassified Rothia (in: high G+C Gram-positive bacteria)]MBM7051143.1 ABC transporter permease [Rothia sp. ZJ1223]QRZ62159.1 ABC transporter permease [Rothia sp. ZJ932]
MCLLRFIGFDLKQSLFNISGVFYLIIMPVGFYLLFGGMQTYGEYAFREGNAAAYVMIGMAVYGAVSGAVSASASSVVEIESGWGRQLALTPLTSKQVLLAQVARALVTTALPVLCVNIIARFTKAEIPLEQQILCALVTFLASSIFVFYGVAFARIFKNPSAISVAAGLLVFFSFFGTTFSPLSPSLLEFARFTPLYGVTQLSRYFFTGGDTVTTDAVNWFVTEPLEYAVLNFLCWSVVFVLSAWLLRHRARSR